MLINYISFVLSALVYTMYVIKHSNEFNWELYFLKGLVLFVSILVLSSFTLNLIVSLF